MARKPKAPLDASQGSSQQNSLQSLLLKNVKVKVETTSTNASTDNVPQPTQTLARSALPGNSSSPAATQHVEPATQAETATQVETAASRIDAAPLAQPRTPSVLVAAPANEQNHDNGSSQPVKRKRATPAVTDAKVEKMKMQELQRQVKSAAKVEKQHQRTHETMPE